MWQLSLTYSSGIYDVGFGVFHIFFWHLFRWPETLKASGSVNRAITQTLNVMLTYVFVVYAIALIWGAHAGADNRLLLSAGAVFWAIRAAAQVMLFRIQRSISAALTALFIAGALLHGLAAIG
jgi:hypothetical protein